MIIWARNLLKATWVESKKTWDHLVETSIKTIKYGGLQDGWIRPQISHCILSRKAGDYKDNLDVKGLIFNLLEHTEYKDIH